jgi:hypothetical protein
VPAWTRPGSRAELLHVLMLPDFDRADRIGEFWFYRPRYRATAKSPDAGPAATMLPSVWMSTPNAYS